MALLVTFLYSRKFEELPLCERPLANIEGVSLFKRDLNQNLLYESPVEVVTKSASLCSDVKVIQQVDNNLAKMTTVPSEHLLLRNPFTGFIECDDVKIDEHSRRLYKVCEQLGQQNNLF